MVSIILKKATGSLNRQVLVGARKFTEFGIEQKKMIPELKSVENSVKINVNHTVNTDNFDI